ncbi:hypothetical protein PM082_010091 [Marasmius tenuissimus]|nr:hypothetical protein PM082_010091 [Marasmius tenuissimus]
MAVMRCAIQARRTLPVDQSDSALSYCVVIILLSDKAGKCFCNENQSEPQRPGLRREGFSRVDFLPTLFGFSKTWTGYQGSALLPERRISPKRRIESPKTRNDLEVF